MKLRKLIAELPLELYRGGQDVEITGLCAHSKWVAPGDLFIAERGSTGEGARHIVEAISTGATALLTDLPDPFLKGVVQLIHPTPKKIEAKLAARFYGYPSQALHTVGITGTNGKTTTAYLVKYLFDRLGFPCGLIGTIEYLIGKHSFEGERTTPDVITNHKLFREMLKQGCSAAVMEVSSHGLDQGRCEEIAFDSAIFTNLSQDHLDYHYTMEKYAEAKQRLFTSLEREKIAIVNTESPAYKTMLATCAAEVITYGFSDNNTLYADEIFLHQSKTEFTVNYQGERARFSWNMIGRYNVLNCLAALAACLTRGVPLNALPPLIQGFKSVPGRLEKIDNLQGLHLFVDYAHTPDALEKVLHCLQEIRGSKGRIITVFGCGGDRDRGKRPKMAKAAEEGGDFTIVTSDNPRSEDPQKICTEIVMGFTHSRFEIVIDRREAIERAIEIATQEDLILIAGKGHETYQLFSYRSIPFDDRKIAQEIANKQIRIAVS